MPRTKQTARRSSIRPVRHMSVDERIRAYGPQLSDDNDERRSDTDESQDRPRSQSEQLHVPRSVSPDPKSPTSLVSGLGAEIPTEPNSQTSFSMNADYDLDDDNNPDDEDTPPPPERANETSTRPDGFASSATEKTILNADNDYSQASQNNTSLSDNVHPARTSTSAGNPQEVNPTEGKEKDVESNTTQTNTKKRILAPNSEEGENDSRSKRSKVHSVDQVDGSKVLNNQVEPAQQVVKKSSNGTNADEEPIKPHDPAHGENDESDETSAKANHDFTNGAFLDFETIPGSPIQGFNAEALNEDYNKMADEYDKKAKAILEEWQNLNAKMEMWLVRGVQMQGAREDCLISHKLQEVNKSVHQATKQRDELVSFCRHMQKAFSMFFPETM